MAVTYPGLKAVAAHRGVALAAVAMDADGIRPDFCGACRRLTFSFSARRPPDHRTITMMLKQNLKNRLDS